VIVPVKSVYVEIRQVPCACVDVRRSGHPACVYIGLLTRP